MTVWGASGEVIYNRTYSRTKPDGTKETWPETVRRVVDGNLALNLAHLLPNEREDLVAMMEEFKILPAGRHLWASGVRGRQYLFNCWVSGWPEEIWEHFRFTFLRLMEGGGVGTNYSNHYLTDYGAVYGPHLVHIVCDEDHPDYPAMKEAGLLSEHYVDDWQGCFEVEDSREGWADALVDLLSTYYRDAKNTNRVFDVSRVRPAGARLKTFGGVASGPAPFARMMLDVAQTMNRLMGWWMDGMSAMEIDHAIATCVVSGGNRRSARMSIMRWDDPQIGEFLTCKSDAGSHWTTNISVEVDDNFWHQVGSNNVVMEDQPVQVFVDEHGVYIRDDDGGMPGAGEYLSEELRSVPVQRGNPQAVSALDAIAEGMLVNGEPGIWNSSLSNVGEPNWVVCPNPCGEQILEPWEPCNLGHINLAAYVKPNGLLDEPGLAKAHRLMTRFCIRATFCDVTDPKSAAVLARNRRIGVGHFGFASMLGLMGIRYADAPQTRTVRYLLEDMADEVSDAATKYAHDLRIPVPVKTRTVAPTGTIAKMPGVSEGIHPIFAKYFIRRIRFSTVDRDQLQQVTEYEDAGYHVEPCKYAPSTLVVEIPTKDSLMAEVESRYGQVEADRVVQSSAELTMDEMLGVQRMYQELWADNAVSYTANILPHSGSSMVPTLTGYIREFGPDLKGLTVFPDLGMVQAPYQHLAKDEYQEYTIRHVSDSVDENCATGACPVR